MESYLSTIKCPFLIVLLLACRSDFCFFSRWFYCPASAFKFVASYGKNMKGVVETVVACFNALLRHFEE